MNQVRSNPGEWRVSLRNEVLQSAQSGRWGVALAAIGWTHLLVFLGCQWLVNPAVKSDPRHAGLWLVDAFIAAVILRCVAGKRWYADSDAAALVVRIWGTFLILCFSLATLNNLTGWTHDWFKPPWATLSSFGFATMAWLFGLRFLVLAVQMYLTGLTMVTFPRWNYLIFGVSWCLALQIIGVSLIAATQGIGKSRKSKGISVATPATPR